MENNNGNSNTGIGFVGMLTIVFIVLKLTGVIAWSWLWVLSPIWICFVLAVILMVLFCVALAFNGTDQIKKRR